TVAAAYGASATVVIRKEAYPVLNNDEALVAFWKSVASDTMGESALVDAQPTMGAEDFAFYAEKVPSCFWVLGVKDPEAADWPHLHTPTYNFNDEALAIGIRLQAEAVLAFQE
ncbi:MAG: M20/M25/M40 family metallo-hydrolase, partial [Opitutales bacterium]|nr:M20/M25/M40 family metallo-hydrolase [Opitutales bacterium]